MLKKGKKERRRKREGNKNDYRMPLEPVLICPHSIIGCLFSKVSRIRRREEEGENRTGLVDITKLQRRPLVQHSRASVLASDHFERRPPRAQTNTSTCSSRVLHVRTTVTLDLQVCGYVSFFYLYFASRDTFMLLRFCVS